MSATESTVWVAAIGAVSAIIVAVITKYRRMNTKPKTFDDGVIHTKIEHMEQHIIRLEENVNSLEKSDAVSNIEIDVLKGIVEELKKEVYK